MSGPLSSNRLTSMAFQLAVVPPKARVEGEIDVGEAGHVAAGVPAGVDLGAFDVAEVSDVVRGPVGALDRCGDRSALGGARPRD